MSLQFVPGVYAMLTYPTSYLCKPEHTMSKFMKKASKEAYGKDIEGKMLSIGNSLLVLENIHPDDTNVFTSNIIGEFENCPNNLHSGA